MGVICGERLLGGGGRRQASPRWSWTGGALRWVPQPAGLRCCVKRLSSFLTDRVAWVAEALFPVVERSVSVVRESGRQAEGIEQ